MRLVSQNRWQVPIRARRAGRVGPSGKPVSNRTIEYDLKFLLTVLNWAARSRDEEGRLLLESNPLRGLKTPKQKNPARVLLTGAEYEAMLKASLLMDWRFRVALVIAHETGHRIGAIRQLRWSDIDLEARTIRWRAEHEKTGHEHRTPVTDEALDALEEARRQNPGIGDAPLFPAPGDPSKKRQPLTDSHLVDESPDAGGTGTQAWPRLALAEAEVRVGPHEPATQGALRAGRLEDRPDRPPVLPAGRRGSAQEGPRRPPEGLRSRQLAGIGTLMSRKPNVPARTRTWGLLLRRQSLYPPELRGRIKPVGRSKRRIAETSVRHRDARAPKPYLFGRTKKMPSRQGPSSQRPPHADGNPDCKKEPLR